MTGYGPHNEQSIVINNANLDLPSFIRSVSSFESQLSLEAAIGSLVLMPNAEPLLISAYDFYLPSKAKSPALDKRDCLLEKLTKLKERECFIILDSGKYEAARTGNLESWSEESYQEVLDLVPCTVAFCFDNLEPPNNTEENIAGVIDAVGRAGRSDVVPVVHAPLLEGGFRKFDSLPSIVFGVASKLQPPLIAVPERELGDGVLQRMATIRQIRKRLVSLGRYQPLHILGTGNPVSIVLLSMAGADAFDGLEWCRTVVDRQSGLLYHHQQFDFFAPQSKLLSGSELVREATADESLDYFFRMAIHNLDFYSDWMKELRQNTIGGSTEEMLQFYLPDYIYDVVRNAL